MIMKIKHTSNIHDIELQSEGRERERERERERDLHPGDAQT
jgi:hypothetical protein